MAVGKSIPVPVNQRRDYGDQKYSARFQEAGDEAEKQFENQCLLHSYPYERFGWNRPSFQSFPTLPKMLRMAPDYVLEVGRKHYFVECKGTGRVAKIKQETLDNIQSWNEILPVRFFVYNSVEDGFCLLSVSELEALVNQFGTWKTFESDGKRYAELPRSAFSFHKELVQCLKTTTTTSKS